MVGTFGGNILSKSRHICSLTWQYISIGIDIGDPGPELLGTGSKPNIRGGTLTFNNNILRGFKFYECHT